MNTFLLSIDWIGRVTTVIFMVALFYGGYLWLKGILPALWRLGNGLSKRKIAIFAKSGNFSSLRDLLIDSKLFNKNNISHISSESDIKKAESQTLFLVYWPDWKETLGKIVNLKKDGTALVIFAPQDKGFIPKKQINLLDERNVMVTNFRGRLLSDIISSLVTTTYQ